MGVPVVLVPYDPRWPRLYDEEKARILGAIGEYIVAVEHIGSTAVPGLGAKPILDIMIAVRDLAKDFPACIEPLRTIGYEYVPRSDFFESRFCCLGAWGASDRHLHITELNSNFWREKVLFRDYLRAHPHAANDYFELKQTLAERHSGNRPAYTEAKASFIHQVVQLANKGLTSGANISHHVR